MEKAAIEQDQAKDVLAEDDIEELEERPKSIILNLIGQFKNNLDLHRITLPIFLLEPRSMLERISDFMLCHDLLFDVDRQQEPYHRFLSVLRYFLAGWHIRPKGVKKPYNSVIGEHFRGKWGSPQSDSGESYFFAEQVSHHPPISAYCFGNKKHNVFITGTLNPTSKFLGNSAATMMNGESHVHLANFPGEVYVIRKPTVYVRGIVFGTFRMEIGDIAYIHCEKTGFSAEIEFKAAGIIKGIPHAIQGTIRHTGCPEPIATISGQWDDQIFLQMPNFNQLFLDVKQLSKNTIITRELIEQGPLESRNLWLKVTEALKKKNDEMAVAEKSRIEQRQRKLLEMSHNHSEIPNFFMPIDETKSKWKFKHWNSSDICHELYDKLESLYHTADLGTKLLEKHFSDDVD